MQKGKHLRFSLRRRPSCCFLLTCVMCIAGSVNPVFLCSCFKFGGKVCEAGRVGRSQKGFLLHEVHGILVFAKGKKTKFLLGCSALAVLLVLWMERNWIFEDYRGAGVEELWDRVKLPQLYGDLFRLISKTASFFVFCLIGRRV